MGISILKVLLHMDMLVHASFRVLLLVSLNLLWGGHSDLLSDDTFALTALPRSKLDFHYTSGMTIRMIWDMIYALWLLSQVSTRSK
jgi:hypothetical protein